MKFAGVFFMLLAAPAAADECMSYKMNPTVQIVSPGWTKSVVQPLTAMDLWHGNVVATMVDNYDITADITSVEDGFCITLKSVEATVGYSDFLVRIDMRHSPGTCSYDAVLSHEDEHIRAYLSVIDDYADELRSAVYSAANSIMPVFAASSDEMDAAIGELNAQLQAHPDLILIKQKIKASEEIRNKRIDLSDTGEALKKCFK